MNAANHINEGGTSRGFSHDSRTSGGSVAQLVASPTAAAAVIRGWRRIVAAVVVSVEGKGESELDRRGRGWGVIFRHCDGAHHSALVLLNSITLLLLAYSLAKQKCPKAFHDYCT